MPVLAPSHTWDRERARYFGHRREFAMFGAGLGVRARILAIALVPSLALVVIGVGSAAYSVEGSRQSEQWAKGLQRAITPTLELIKAVQVERHLTMAYLTGDSSATVRLPAARQRFDIAARRLLESSNDLQRVHDSAIVDDTVSFNLLADNLAKVRAAADAKKLPVLQAYTFYNHVVDGVTLGSGVAQQAGPDASAVGISESLRLLSAVDAISRSYAVGYVLVTAGSNAYLPFTEFIQQAGYYHTSIGRLAVETDTTERARINAIVMSADWSQLSAIESAVSQRAVIEVAYESSGRSPRSIVDQGAPYLPLMVGQWQSAATGVDQALINLWIADSDRTQALAADRAHRSAIRALEVGVALLTISLSAIVVAVFLAGRIIQRLQRLGGRTLEFAYDSLPAILQSLRDGRPVEPMIAIDESLLLDYGRDKID